MPDAPQLNAALDPAFFEGRLLIDILAWDWNLRVAICSAETPPKSRFQGGLDYGRDFLVRGRVRAPKELRGRTIKVRLSPFGPKVRFGRGGLQQVGRLTVFPPAADTDFEAMLMLPESAIPAAATSLATIWKHIQLLTFDEGLEEAKVSAYFFAAEIHPNLQAWANAE